MGQWGMETAAGSINVAAGEFVSRTVNGTSERGHGRNLGPVDVVVSALHITLVKLDILKDCTYQK
jgi:hypothetical protein